MKKCYYTCDKQVLWESAGAFFPRDNSLVSDRKSHSLNLWPCKSQLLALGIEVNWDFLRSAKQKDVGSSLALDQNFLCMFFRLCDFFSQFFFMSPKISPFIFLESNTCRVLFCSVYISNAFEAA